MLTFTSDLLIDIIRHVNPTMASEFELDPEDLETIAEEMNEDSDLQDKINDLL